jgi:hypothetical protein
MTSSGTSGHPARPAGPGPARFGLPTVALALLLVSTGLVAAASSEWGGNPSRATPLDPGRPGPAPEVSVVGPVAIGNQTVAFSVGAAGLAALYSPRISIANGSVGPGNSSQAKATFTGANATLSVTVPGLAAAKVTIPALGAQSVRIPGLNYTIAGTPVDVYADVFGSVNGTTFVGANGTGANASFSWSSSATLAIPFTATARAPATIEVGVANLTYDLRVGVVAQGTVAGHPVSVPLMAPTALPAAPGDPANVAGRFAIVAPPPVTPPSNPPKAATPGLTISAPLAVGAVAAALVVGLALGWIFHRRSSAGAADPRQCRGCGRRLPRGASFCPSCARPVGPDPAGPVAPPGAAP